MERLEKAISPGLSYKQFQAAEKNAEEAVLLELGDSALDHFIHSKFREQLNAHRLRLEEECRQRYLKRCQKAQKEVLVGNSNSVNDDEENGDRLFHNFARYMRDPGSIEHDWTVKSEQFLEACGLQPEEQSEECRLMVDYLLSSTRQLITCINEECRAQVSHSSRSLLSVQEQLDEKILSVSKLQGEKESQAAVANVLQGRIAGLIEQLSQQESIISELRSKAEINEAEIKRSRVECETTTMKCSNMVGRLVSKTKEVSHLIAEKNSLATENETLSYHLKQQKQKQKEKSSKKSKGVSNGSAEDASNLQAELEVLRDLNISYNKQVLELQESLDATKNKCEDALDSVSQAERLMSADKNKLEASNESLKSMSEKVHSVIKKHEKLDLEHCKLLSEYEALEKHQKELHETFKSSQNVLRREHADQVQALVSQVNTLRSDLAASQQEVEACSSSLQEMEEAKESLAKELSIMSQSEKLDESVGPGRRDHLMDISRELKAAQDTLHREREAHKAKLRSSAENYQNRINEIDMAYFRVEAELKVKSEEAKKYYSKTRHLEEEANAQDRLRRKAETKLEEEVQKCLQTKRLLDRANKEIETLRESLRGSEKKLEALQREFELQQVSCSAAQEDAEAAREMNTTLKEVISRLRVDVKEKNDLDFGLSEMTKERDQLAEQVASLEKEVSSLIQVRGELAESQARVAQLESRREEVESKAIAVEEKAAEIQDMQSKTDEATRMNTLLLEENGELESQMETLSIAFEQRGELLRDFERRLDVCTSDSAYLRNENVKYRDQVRELGEKVQTLLSNYNEASSQNEKKGFELLKLNGEHHEMQENLNKIAGELAELRDLPGQLSRLKEEHRAALQRVEETQKTLEELSKLSASEIEEKEQALRELTVKHETLSSENEALANAYGNLEKDHKLLVEDREALYSAYTELDNKLTHIEAEIME